MRSGRVEDSRLEGPASCESSGRASVSELVPTAAAGSVLAGVCPPMVERGAKLHGSRVEVVLDWARLRGPMSCFAPARRMLEAAFGAAESAKGRAGYASRLRFEAGAELWFGSERDDCVACMSGSALGVLEPWERWQLIEGLRMAGFRWTTRMDIAVDFRGEGQRLVEATRKACERGELCHARVWEEAVFHNGDGVAGSMVRIGRRGGNGSGRYVRVYDKGLQTGTAKRGCWERWETEFTGVCAEEALVMMFQAEHPEIGRLWVSDTVRQLEGWSRQAVELAFGAVDFRDVTGAKALRRRRRSRWWSEVIGGLELRRVCEDRKRFVGLDATAEWLRKAVAPTVLSMARRTGRSVEQVFGDLVGEAARVPSVLRASVFAYECQYGGKRPRGEGGSASGVT